MVRIGRSAPTTLAEAAGTSLWPAFESHPDVKALPNLAVEKTIVDVNSMPTARLLRSCDSLLPSSLRRPSLVETG